MCKLPILLLALVSSLLAQSEKTVSINPGFKLGSRVGGTNLSGLYNRQTEDRWTGGPSLELRLPYRFAVEFIQCALRDK